MGSYLASLERLLPKAIFEPHIPPTDILPDVLLEYLDDLAGEAGSNLASFERFYSLRLKSGHTLSGSKVNRDDAILGAHDIGICFQVLLQDINLSISPLITRGKRAVEMSFS